MRNKWLIALATIGIHICIGGVYAWSVLVNPIMQECGFNMTETSFVFSLAIFFLGVSASTMGKMVDEKGAGFTGLLSMVLYCGGLVLAGLAVHLHSLILLYLSYGCLVGIGLGLGYVTPVSTLVKHFPNHAGVASGIAIMGFGFGAVLASPVMQYIVATYDLTANFLFMAVIYSVIMGLSVNYLLPIAPSGTKKTSENISVVYSTKEFRTLFVAFFINIAVGIGLLAVISPMLQEKFYLDPVSASAFVGLVGLVNGLGRLCWASLSDWLGRKQTYLFMFIFQYLLFAVLASTNNEYVFKISVLLIISCYGGGFSCMPAMLSDLFGKKYLSTIHGKILLAWGLAGLVSPLAVALCKSVTGSYTAVLFICSALCLYNHLLIRRGISAVQ